VKRQEPAFVAELFNHGDPALNNTTPLLMAIRLGKDEIAEMLLQGGAEVNKPGAWGLTPLMYAAVYGRVGVAKLILERGGEDLELKVRVILTSSSPRPHLKVILLTSSFT
jgi:hypothetical protein